MRKTLPRVITAEDFVYFFQQLATLIAAGITLMQGLTLLRHNQEKTSLRSLIDILRTDLENGREFNRALQRFPNYIDAVTCRIIGIGEKTGTLDHMLTRVASSLQKKAGLKTQLKQALFYPAILSLAALATTLMMLLFIVPHFMVLFEHFPRQLPFATQGIIHLSYFIRRRGLGIMMVITVFFVLQTKTTLFKIPWQSPLMRLPYLSTLRKKILLVRFARNLATALSAAIPLTEALILVSSLGGDELSDSVQKLYAGVNAGKHFHSTLGMNPFFPPLLVQMTRTGEESGTLDLMLEKFADIYEASIQRSLSTLSHLLEPLIISILGVLIGGIVVAMYLPLFELGTAF